MKFCYFGAFAKILWATPEKSKKSTPWEEILPTPMTEYVPEEAARRAGSDCGPEREDSSDSGMGVGRMFSRGATRGFFQNFSRGTKVVKFVFSLESISAPSKYFRKFFDEAMMECIAEQINLYAVQRKLSISLMLTWKELEIFLLFY